MTVVFTDVNVVAMTSQAVAPGQTVVVADGIIDWIGPAEAADLPPTAIRIDGAGRYLIPGLCDMHVHIVPHVALPSVGADADDLAMDYASQYLRLFLDHGVTTVRNMAGSEFLLRVRAAAARGAFPAPRIFTTGPILETVYTFAGLASYAARITSPAGAAAEVRRQADLGYDFIKVYNQIDADIYDALVGAAREVGVPVVGHVPFAKGLEGVVSAGQDSIEHFRGFDVALDARPVDARVGEQFSGWRYATARGIAELAERIGESRTWNVPTLLVENPLGAEAVHSARDIARLPWWLAEHLRAMQRTIPFTETERSLIKDGQAARHALLVELDRVGAGLMTGSDCPGAGCRLIPGRSLWDELAAFVAAGLSPYRALKAATVDAAVFLGRSAQQGAVEVGKVADLVLLDADPLADIRALSRQAGVMAQGKWFPTA